MPLYYVKRIIYTLNYTIIALDIIKLVQKYPSSVRAFHHGSTILLGMTFWWDGPNVECHLSTPSLQPILAPPFILFSFTPLPPNHCRHHLSSFTTHIFPPSSGHHSWPSNHDSFIPPPLPPPTYVFHSPPPLTITFSTIFFIPRFTTINKIIFLPFITVAQLFFNR